MKRTCVSRAAALALSIFSARVVAAQSAGSASPPLTVNQRMLEMQHAEGRLSDEQYLVLRAQADAEAKAAAAAAAATSKADWLDRFSLFGDVRIRGEAFFQDGTTDRFRERFRVRLGVKAVASSELEAQVRLATGDPGDPISEMQTTSELFTRKPVNLDLAYVSFKPSTTFGWSRPWLTLLGGKFTNPVWKPRANFGSEIVFDEDLAPEGFQQIVSPVDAKDGLVRKVEVQAFEWSAKEVASGGDSWVFGGQGSASFGIGSAVTVTGSLADYYFSSPERIAQEFNTNSKINLTNSLMLKDGTVVKGGTPYKAPTDEPNPVQDFLYGFNVLNPAVQVAVDTGAAAWPVSVYVDFAHNTEASDGNADALGMGVSVGQTKKPGELALGAGWQRIETNAVISSFVGSDFGKNGGTNVTGPQVKLDWMPLDRLVLTGRSFFVKQIDVAKGKPNATVTRLQLDANYSF
ncbi:MAG: putative porin [Deltaproteobacteria bacterium]|nr:putative porin [Deltaproteobacteria bacterium]